MPMAPPGCSVRMRTPSVFQNSAKRLYLPELPIDDFIGSVAALVKRDVNWVPTRREYTLYMRPFMFASEPFLACALRRKWIIA